MKQRLDCGHYPSPHSPITDGYGTDASGKTFCYACCAQNDKKDMRETGRAILYLTKDGTGYKVTNWPGSLVIRVKSFRTSRHNMGGTRVDFWFTFEGQNWHGYQIGQWNEIAHCKRIK
jgi:hypothetical protein